MEADFWHERWETNRIGFHEQSANPLLVAHFESLSLEPKSRIFVPLCGKTSAIAWILSQRHSVVGIELNEQAVIQLFIDLKIEPVVTDLKKLKRYEANDVTIFVGDIFDLSAAELGQIDAVFDRAALVALPNQMRDRYTKHLVVVTNAAPQLLITFTYDQQLRDGPPFSISSEEIFGQYENKFSIKQLERKELPGGLRGTEATEAAWLLTTRHD